jgi:hypothetical protein
MATTWLAWFAVGDFVPITVNESPASIGPRWPSLSSMGATWLGATAVLVIVALAVSRRRIIPDSQRL